MADRRIKPSLPIATVDELCIYAARGVSMGFQEWYNHAAAEIGQVAKWAGWSKQRLIDIIALTSPRCAVRRNVRIAYHYMEHGEFLGGVVRGVRRSVDHYNETGEIRGKKTGPFARALAGCPDAIVLDTWMAKAILPDLMIANSGGFARIATRAAANDVVRHVGARFSMSPAAAQAVIWAGVFEAAGGDPPFFPIVEEWERFVDYDRSFPASGHIEEEPTTYYADASDEPF